MALSERDQMVFDFLKTFELFNIVKKNKQVIDELKKVFPNIVNILKHKPEKVEPNNQPDLFE